MWYVKGQELRMAEGDFGVALPLVISGTTFTENDQVKLTIKNKDNGTTILEKVFSDIVTRYNNGMTTNTVNLVLTDNESALLPVGSYVYCIDWYQSGAFMCNVIPTAPLKVVDKA